MNIELAHKNFMDDVENSDKAEMLSEIESILWNPELLNMRIAYLESVSMLSKGETEGIENPMSHGQVVSCVKKGISTAVKEGIVGESDVLRLAHSIKGLHAFTNAVSEVEKELRAVAFADALKSPVKFPAIDLDKVKSGVSRGINWADLSQFVLDWYESLMEPNLKLSMATRGESDEDDQELAADAEIAENELVKQHLNRLRDLPTALLPDELKNEWGQIPFDNLIDSLKKKSTWSDFLKRSGEIINETLDQKSIEKLIELMNSDDEKFSDYYSEFRLLEAILESSKYTG
ncbi:MAG TPA: hypothetical protein VGB30_11300 [bacterium]